MNGVINFLKPPGMSSNHAVGFFKKLLDFKKIGHAGTLDPGACGVLVVLVGKATKLSDHLMAGSKTYIGEITFGACTDTQDAYGSITETSEKIILSEMLEAILPQFVGEIDQTPSRYSAVKVDGERAYARARRGEEFALKTRKVRVDRLRLLTQTGDHRFLLEIVCSRGTYIRALFEDIAQALRTCAYMSFLERTASGGFFAENAVTMEEAEAMAQTGEAHRLVMPVEQVLADIPKAMIDKADYKRFSNGLGGRVASAEADTNGGLYRVYCNDDFFGLGSVADGRAKISTHLFEGDGNEKHQV